MKSFKRITALSLVLVIFSTFTACKLFSGDAETTTDLSKDDMLTLTDPEGVGGTDYQGNTLKDVDAGEEISRFDEEQEIISEEGNPTTKAVTTKKDSNSSVTLPPANNFNTIQQEFFAKGIFTLEGTMFIEKEDVKLNMPYKIAMNGSEKYVSADFTMQGITARILMNPKKTYMLLPGLKLYQETDSGFSGLGDVSGLTGTTTHASTKEVQIGNDIYICEERKNSNGDSTYFYFLDGQLARIKIVKPDGVSLLIVESLKASVNKEEFELPEGYKKANLSDWK